MISTTCVNEISISTSTLHLPGRISTFVSSLECSFSYLQIAFVTAIVTDQIQMNTSDQRVCFHFHHVLMVG